MRIQKYFVHPLVIVLTVVSFSLFATGCEKTVTKYDENGKPYSATEPDPWTTIGGILLAVIITAWIAYAIDRNQADETTTTTTYKKSTRNFHFDNGAGFKLVSLPSENAKFLTVQVEDSKGNYIATYIFDKEKLLSSRGVDYRSCCLSSAIDKKAMAEMIKGIGSITPDIKRVSAKVSCVSSNPLRLQIKDVAAYNNEEPNENALTVKSGFGSFAVSVNPGSSNELNISVTRIQKEKVVASLAR